MRTLISLPAVCLLACYWQTLPFIFTHEKYIFNYDNLLKSYRNNSNYATLKDAQASLHKIVFFTNEWLPTMATRSVNLEIFFLSWMTHTVWCVSHRASYNTHVLYDIHSMPVESGLQSALNRHTVRLFTESDDTRGSSNTIFPPEDEQGNARNMLRIVM